MNFVELFDFYWTKFKRIFKFIGSERSLKNFEGVWPIEGEEFSFFSHMFSIFRRNLIFQWNLEPNRCNQRGGSWGSMPPIRRSKVHTKIFHTNSSTQTPSCLIRSFFSVTSIFFLLYLNKKNPNQIHRCYTQN